MVAVALGDQVPAGSNGGLLADIAADHPDLTWDLVAPHFDDPKLPLSKNEPLTKQVLPELDRWIQR